MSALGVGEGEPIEQPASLSGIVVRDRGLEPLALWRRLAQLPAEPAKQADRRLVGHGV